MFKTNRFVFDSIVNGYRITGAMEYRLSLFCPENSLLVLLVPQVDSQFFFEFTFAFHSMVIC